MRFATAKAATTQANSGGLEKPLCGDILAKVTGQSEVDALLCFRLRVLRGSWEVGGCDKSATPTQFPSRQRVSP